jgi:hypothetical protein
VLESGWTAAPAWARSGCGWWQPQGAAGVLRGADGKY